MRRKRDKRRSQLPLYLLSSTTSPIAKNNGGPPPLDQAGGYALFAPPNYLISPSSTINHSLVSDSDDGAPPSKKLLIDLAYMLQFSLPATVDLRLSYGAGYGGVNREREKRYIPSVPPEFLVKLDLGEGMTGRVGEGLDGRDWNTDA